MTVDVERVRKMADLVLNWRTHGYDTIPIAQPVALADDTLALCDELDRTREQLREAREALQWCGGSDDFAYGGKAREGWERIVMPILSEATP